jgi:hypothetical protein
VAPATPEPRFSEARISPSILVGLDAAFPDLIFSSNITPYENGIAGWTVADESGGHIPLADKTGIFASTSLAPAAGS